MSFNSATCMQIFHKEVGSHHFVYTSIQMDNKLTNKKKQGAPLNTGTHPETVGKTTKIENRRVSSLLFWRFLADGLDYVGPKILMLAVHDWFFLHQWSFQSCPPVLASFYSFKIRSFRMSQKSSMEVISIRKFDSLKCYLPLLFLAVFFTTCLCIFGGIC